MAGITINRMIELLTGMAQNGMGEMKIYMHEPLGGKNRIFNIQRGDIAVVSGLQRALVLMPHGDFLHHADQQEVTNIELGRKH